MNMKRFLSAGVALALMGACYAPESGGGSGSGSSPSPDAEKKKAADAAAALKAKEKEEADKLAAKAKADAEKKKADEEAEKERQSAIAKQQRTDVLDAVNKLEHETDADWNNDGTPSLKRVQGIVGDNRITQELLDEVAGDLKRKKVGASTNAGQLAVKTEKGQKGFVENKLVRAKEVGQYGGKLRYPGEKFYVTGVLRKWMEVVKD